MWGRQARKTDCEKFLASILYSPTLCTFSSTIYSQGTLARAFISGNLMHGRKVGVLALSRSILDFSWRFSFPLFERLVGCPSAAAKYKKKMGMYKSVGNGLMSRKAHNSFSHCYYCCSYTAPPYVPKIHRRVMLKPAAPGIKIIFDVCTRVSSNPLGWVLWHISLHMSTESFSLQCKYL